MSPDEAINDPHLLGWGNGYDTDDEAEHAAKSFDDGHVNKDNIHSPKDKSQKPNKHHKHHDQHK